MKPSAESLIETLRGLIADNADRASTRYDMLGADEVLALIEACNAVVFLDETITEGTGEQRRSDNE